MKLAIKLMSLIDSRELKNAKAELAKTQGMLDCATGVKAVRDDENYVAGYGIQYELEQRKTSNTIEEL